MSSASGRKAQAKAIGEDVEFLVTRDVDALRLADGTDAHHDAITDGLLTPSSTLPFGSICLLEAGTPVEIKACRASTSNGDQNTPGRWFFKGRRDGQHDVLLDAAGAYLLAVYQEDDGDREVVRKLLLPATIVDDLLRDSWYESGRVEGEVAKLAWTTVLDGGDST